MTESILSNPPSPLENKAQKMFNELYSQMIEDAPYRPFLNTEEQILNYLFYIFDRFPFWGLVR